MVYHQMGVYHLGNFMFISVVVSHHRSFFLPELLRIMSLPALVDFDLASTYIIFPIK